MAKSTESSELKFLLELIGVDGYRSKLTAIKRVGSADLRNASCKSLLSKGHLDCSQEIKKFVTEGPGKELLKKTSDSLPINITPKELAILKAGLKNSPPSAIGKAVPAGERQDLLRNLTDRGLVKASKTATDEVWLSAQGKQFLRDDCSPTGSWAITASKLGNYLAFLRENSDSSPSSSSQRLPTGQPRAQRPLSQQGGGPSTAMPIGSQTKPDAGAVFQQIRRLDQLVGTDNYLPIYHLREKLQPPLTREELDNRLYELQRTDRIELSSLHDQGDYSDSQISAGIAQNHGRSLFFIAVI